ncbi:hypothetical protein ACN47E_004587 [Coniothyrium glycines]
MKYSLIFAATAAAYDAYGAGYKHGEEQKSSSVKASSTPKPIGYTTIYPGYDKHPVTVTTQHQPYPTCVSAGYDAKSCGKWEDDTYVSTTVKDYDGNYKVITKTDEPVTVYHTKKTITHSATGKYGYPTPSAGYAAPTGSPYSKNGTDGCWYELYEKVEEVPYKKLGPHALPGYPGSGLYPEGDKEQPVKVKEYKGGKWSEYEHVYKYGTPEEVKTYEKPGVYTEPAKDVYVDKPYTKAAEATKYAKAGETCTYGGAYVDAKKTGYVTGAYGAYETKYVSGKPVTETVVKYTTVYVTKTGKVEVAKPTTTVYDHDTKVAYPTAKEYDAGYYHQDAKTITITKSGEAYTCSYEKQKATPTPKKDEEYPVYPTKTPSHDDYGYNSYKATPTPKKPTGDDKEYPVYPVKGNGTHGDYEAKSTPVAIYSKAYDHADYPASSYPAKATSTPCDEDDKHKATPTASVYKPYGGEHKSVPAAKSTPVYNAYPVPTPSKPVHDDKDYEEYKPSHVVPAKASSTPCDDDEKKPYPTPAQPYDGKHAEPTPAKATPVYDAGYHAEPAKSTPVYEETKDKYPAATPAAYGAGYKRSRIARAL